MTEICIIAVALGGPVEPFNYLDLADSPWLDQAGFAVADCEGGVFDLLGVTPSTGEVIFPSAVTDSVDGDDGSVDGNGNGGHSFFANGFAGITFTLDPGEIGFTPTRAGVVWTDGTGMVIFEAFDLDGNSLGVTQADIADDNFGGGTSEDHFFGYEHPGGIGSIHIATESFDGMEVDHVQYAGGDVVDCAPDCNGDGNLNILDFVCFQSMWQAQSPDGDCDANGQFNILDFVCFQGLFQQGCP